MPVTIRARNFQSISDATLHVEGFTVVTGQNNVGKSALMRAARGLFQNAGGTSFIREGETLCTVRIDFGQDGSIEWSKGKGPRDRPTYRINNQDPIYPGASVPEELAAFGVVPIMVGGQEVWPSFAPQFSGQVFLLDRPGSALAEAVSDVERVGQLNRALRRAESDKRQAAATLKVRRADASRQAVEVAAFDRLEDAEALASSAHLTHSCLLKIQVALDTLKTTHAALRGAVAAIEALEGVASLQAPSSQDASELFTQLASLRKLQEQMDQARMEVQRLERIASVEISPASSPQSLDLLRAWEAATTMHASLRRLQQEEADAQRRLSEAQQDLATAQHDLDTIWSQAGQCPWCGSTEGSTHDHPRLAHGHPPRG
jgi:hypothetical protein